MSEKWMDEITVDLVPERYRHIVELIGIDNMLLLTKSFGGTMLYVPMYDSLIKSLRNEKIKQEFNGGNYKELAKKYSLCESQIRNIINYDGVDGQVSLFG